MSRWRTCGFRLQPKEGPNQDFLEGPHDEIIKTANFPVITSIVGLAYAGKSPFSGEVYFINLAGSVQMKFGIPFFGVFDPRFLDFAVPVSARGSITFNITDYKGFIKLNRMIDFQIEDFKKQINQALLKYVGVITNIPEANGIPVIQLERKILEVNDLVETKVKEVLETDFGVSVKRFDLGSIEIDKTSVGYAELRKITSEQQTKTIEAQANINIKTLRIPKRINSENMEELENPKGRGPKSSEITNGKPEFNGSSNELASRRRANRCRKYGQDGARWFCRRWHGPWVNDGQHGNGRSSRRRNGRDDGKYDERFESASTNSLLLLHFNTWSCSMDNKAGLFQWSKCNNWFKQEAFL